MTDKLEKHFRLLRANEDVINYLQGKSADSDDSEALRDAVEGLGGVQTFCPNPAQHKYFSPPLEGWFLASPPA